MIFTFMVTYVLGILTGMVGLVGLILVVDWEYLLELKKEREWGGRW